MNKELINQVDSLRKLVVETGAKELLVAANQVTPLEITTLLKKKVGQYHWTKESVQDILTCIEGEGKLTSVDNGNYKIFSGVKGAKLGEQKLSVSEVTKNHISKTDALKLMQNNKGHFFTVTFVNQSGALRTMNAQYLKDQGPTNLGYVKVRETSKMAKEENAIRNVNLQTIQELKIGGKTLKVG